jgi:hypothetical protein
MFAHNLDSDSRLHPFEDLETDPSTLDGFIRLAGTARGVALQSLAPGTVVTVKTQNTRYRLVVLDGAERRVRISGGWVFPEVTDVRVAGSTDGGSTLKLGWIGEGFRLELATDLGPVTTSPVQSVIVDEEPMVH